MSKRSATEVNSSSGSHLEPRKTPRSESKRKEDAADDEMGEFEDGWEDEYESDEDVVDGEQGKGDDSMDVDDEVMPPIEESEEPPQAPEAFIPGVHKLGKDEILEPDDSVYIMRHNMTVNWPCLSFDVLRDNLGDQRQRYPATAYIVTGTQADVAKNNEIQVYKMSSLHKTQKEHDTDDEDEEDDDALDEDPVLEHRSVPHLGGVNRIRAQPLPASSPLPPVSQPYYVASWAETGKVHIWDVRPLIEALDVPGYAVDKSRTHTPAFTISSHGRAEGFAMDWAASGGANPSALRLLTGDVHAKIFLTTTTPSGFNALAQPFASHTSSVEDLQWSPSEPTVFASCSADQSVRVWDVRAKGRQSVAGIARAHESDVNVISWNRATTYLLLSGGDEGGIKVWDLRNVKKAGTAPDPSPVAAFTWHTAPITSIEWHPTEDSIFAASGADDQVTLWDLAVEQDDEEAGPMDATEGGREVPPQLLFVHQGQKDVKEVHWHPQIPGAVISTAYDGFNIFKTISV
ncbi:glutamate-rich WD repeat containing [Dichomitus squalens]|uniref:Glutamate-rich WD repeat-containing protein 1 n=1 Tax=Dichomitus squalens TaxID=114155 RepID=A0A4Q9P4H6_9APHY|nr:glutamate-rich WD repeat containing [Dichomitus squalens LYAD-421 SS1]EJF67199.1 glutamate-rich WD repeat containing [Dichomitus squalens LYAD-421 SS1]TBU25330.1 glutamate-rich WD repeat containing [Dichomitus squalens]TBU49320.1 glutamate-rich WD repeat containing [Dichomitus squalens]